MFGEIDERIWRVMRVRRRSRCRRYDFVHRCHRWDELAPGGRRVLGSHPRNMIRQGRLRRARIQGVVHVARDAGRRGHVFVSRRHRVRRYRDVRNIFRCRFAENFILLFKIFYSINPKTHT